MSRWHQQIRETIELTPANSRNYATYPRIMAPSPCTRNREVAAAPRLATATEEGHGGVAPPHTIAAHLFAASLPPAPPTHDGSIEDARAMSQTCHACTVRPYVHPTKNARSSLGQTDRRSVNDRLDGLDANKSTFCARAAMLSVIRMARTRVIDDGWVESSREHTSRSMESLSLADPYPTALVPLAM
jgi:hypothetical protein